MTKTLLTKIVIGVLATGTVGTVGLVVASKNPATAETVKSVPVVGQYIDVVTFNKGLNEEEFNQLMEIYDYHKQFLKRQQWIQENYPTAMTIIEITDDPNAHWRTEAIGDNQELSNKALDDYIIFTKSLHPLQDVRIRITNKNEC